MFSFFRYYHSRWDDATNVGIYHGFDTVCRVANYVARLLWALSMSDTEIPDDLIADCATVSTFFFSPSF